MGRKCCLVPVALAEFDLAIPLASVLCTETCRLLKPFNELVHARNGIRIPHDGVVQLLVVTAEAR